MKRILSHMNKNLFILFSTGLIAANIGYFTQSIVGGLLALAFFLLAPGYLVVSRWKNVQLEGWVIFSLSFGMGLLFMMVGGLFLNSLHFLGLSRPLSPIGILCMLDVIMGALLWLARKDLISRRLPKLVVGREPVLVVAALSTLPLFGAFGAIRINNGGSSVVTMLGFAIAALLFIFIFCRKQLKSVYPYAVFAIGLTVLLALSMRSWQVSGHDVRHEYGLFVQVLQHGFWSNALSFPGDTYNACTSITILPTVLAAVSHVSSDYVFKLLMQILFALGLVPMYLFAKRLGGPRRALLASLLFIGFPTFVNDMPFLVRQEFAFVFFSLLLLSAFLGLRRKLATCVTLAFMTGLILSHYSSGYVALAILLMAWAIYRIAEKLCKLRGLFRTPLLSLPVLIIALLFTFFWNAQATGTTGSLKNTIKSTVTGIFNGSSARSNGVHYSILSGKSETSEKVLADYAKGKRALVKLVSEHDMPPTRLGEHLASARTLNAFNGAFRGLSAKLLQVLLLIGIFYFFIRNRTTPGRRSLYFYSLAAGSVVMMALITLLPQLSVDYGLTRLFLQTMVIVGVPIVIGLELLLSMTRKLQLPIMVACVVLFFLHLSGFVPQLIGGYPPQLALNNSGVNYDIYYRHEGETMAMKALSEKYNDLPPAMDMYAMSRKPTLMPRLKYIADPVVSTNPREYLYLDYANVHSGNYANYLQGNVLEYSYDDPSLRSRLYANRESQIYLRNNQMLKVTNK